MQGKLVEIRMNVEDIEGEISGGEEGEVGKMSGGEYKKLGKIRWK